MGSVFIALIRDVRSVRGVRAGVNKVQTRNTARQSIHK